MKIYLYVVLFFAGSVGFAQEISLTPETPVLPSQGLNIIPMELPSEPVRDGSVQWEDWKKSPDGPKRLAIKVTLLPQSNRVGNFLVQIAVPRRSENRILIVKVDGDWSTTSQKELEGENAPLRANFTIASVPEGYYEITAILVDVYGHQTRVRTLARVGMPPSDG